MKIKDLLNFYAFQGAEFKDYKTYEKIINQEIEKMDKYFALHRWLTVYLILKEEDE